MRRSKGSEQFAETRCIVRRGGQRFWDALALTFADTDHTEVEDRSRTYGISNKARLLVVIHTERRNGIRIISARKATRYEKSIYENG